MRTLRCVIWIVMFVIALAFLFSFSCANASETNQDTTSEATIGLSSAQPQNDQDVQADDERNNFDIASLLSLLGVGLLKFVDDKLKIRFKDKFNTYKRTLIITTVVFVIL